MEPAYFPYVRITSSLRVDTKTNKGEKMIHVRKMKNFKKYMRKMKMNISTIKQLKSQKSVINEEKSINQENV